MNVSILPSLARPVIVVGVLPWTACKIRSTSICLRLRLDHFASPQLADSHHRTDRNAMASTTNHPTMTKEATAPAVILAFSFVV